MDNNKLMRKLTASTTQEYKTIELDMCITELLIYIMNVIVNDHWDLFFCLKASTFFFTCSFHNCISADLMPSISNI